MTEEQMIQVAEAQQAIRHHLLVVYQEYNKKEASATEEQLGALDAEYEDLEEQERQLWDQLQSLYFRVFTGREPEITEVRKIKSGSVVTYEDGMGEFIPAELIPEDTNG